MTVIWKFAMVRLFAIRYMTALYCSLQKSQSCLNIGHCVLGKYGQTNRPVQAAENAKHFIAKY